MDSVDKIYNVEVAPAANDRIAEHFEFLARVDENAANKLLNEMLKDIRSLESMPERCPPYNRPYLPVGKYRYKISYKRYRIVFQVVDDNVFVDDIQDCRQSDDKSIL